MGSCANGVNCGLVEWVKRNALRWFERRIERMGNEDVCEESESVGSNSRGRPPGRWRDRVKEYMCERGATRWGGLVQTKRECLDRERLETILPWPPSWGMLLKGARRQSYRYLDR